MTQQSSVWSSWQPQPVATLLNEKAAEVELVRCALPASLARSNPDVAAASLGVGVNTSENGAPGTPVASWFRSRTGHDDVQQVLIAWCPCDGPCAAQTWWALIEISLGNGVEFLDGSPDVLPVDRLAEVVQLQPTRRIVWPEPLPFTRKLEPSESELPNLSDREAAVTEAPTGSTELAPQQENRQPHEGPKLPLFQEHEELFKAVAEENSNLLLRRKEGVVADASAWRDAPAQRLIGKDALKFCDFIDEHVENFSVDRGKDAQHFAVFRRALPFYSSDVCLYTLVDRRGIRDRTARFLVAHDKAIAVALSTRGDPIHSFTRALIEGNNENDSPLKSPSEAFAAAYLDFFCRSCYGGKADRQRSNFSTIASEKDLWWAENKSGVGIWPLVAEGQTEDQNQKRIYYFSAVVIYSRQAFLAAFRVQVDTAAAAELVIETEMLADTPLHPASLIEESTTVFSTRETPILPVGQGTIDSDSSFFVRFGPEALDGVVRSAMINRGEGDAAFSGSSNVQSAAALESLAEGGTRSFMSDGLGGEFPNVKHSVEWRGRQDLPRSLSLRAFRFRQRVDLREIHLKGSLDLSHCVFYEPLYLQDAEIEGSLDLTGASLLAGGNLRGAIVKGNLRLGGVLIGRTADDSVGLELSGIRVEGDLSLLGMTESLRSTWPDPGVRIRGAHIEGRLLMGDDRVFGRKSRFSVGYIDARGVNIAGTTSIRGTTFAKFDVEQLFCLDMTGAVIGGDFECGPRDPRGWDRPLGTFDYCVPPEKQSGPRPGESPEYSCFNTATRAWEKDAFPKFGALTLDHCRITGSLRIYASDLQRLSAKSAEVGGSVEFVGAIGVVPKTGGDDVFTTVLPVSVSSAVDLNGARIGSDVSLCGVRMGELSVEHADIGGGVRAALPGVGALPANGLSGRKETNYWFRSIVSGAVSMRNSKVRGFVWLVGCTVGSLNLMESVISGYVALDPLSRIFESAFEVDDSGNVLPNSHGRTVVLGTIACVTGTFQNQFRLRAVAVGGIVRMEGATIAGLRLLPAFVGRREPKCEQEIQPTQIGGLSMHHCSLTGALDLSLLQVFGRLDPSMRGNQGVVMSHISVAGDACLWKIGMFRDLRNGDREQGLADPDKLPSPWEFSAAVVGGVRLIKSKIVGDAILSFAKISQDVDLGDTTVEGDIVFGSRLSHKESVDRDAELQHEMLESRKKHQSDAADALRYRACARRLDARTLKALNDVVLDGLIVHQAIDMQHAVIEHGEVTAYSDGSYLATGEREARRLSSSLAFEALDVSYSRLRHLKLPVTPQASNAPLGATATVNLERSAIATLSVLGADGSTPIQLRLNPSGSEITVWNVCDAEKKPNLDLFAELLEQANASDWLGVETYLRREDLNHKADVVYRRMKRIEDGRKYLLQRPSLDTPGRALLQLVVFAAFWVAALWFALLLPDSPVVSALSILALLLFTAILVSRSPARAGGTAGSLIDRVQTQLNQLGMRGLSLEKLTKRAYGFFLGYGTQVLSVMMMWLTLLVVVMPFYVSADNFKFSNAALAGEHAQLNEEKRKDKLTEERDKWRVGNLLGFVAKNHVPIVTVEINQDWDAKAEKPLMGCLPVLTKLPSLVCEPSHTVEISWLSAESLFTVVQMINWLLWPVFLTFLALRIWRRGSAV
jgi:hypothetical protein